MQRNWTSVGEQCGIDRDILTQAIDELEREWVDLPHELGFSQGYAIKAAIAEFRIPKVKRVADGGIGPMGFYGIEGQYTNGRARVYFVDDGCSLVPVCSDFYPA